MTADGGIRFYFPRFAQATDGLQHGFTFRALRRRLPESKNGGRRCPKVPRMHSKSTEILPKPPKIGPKSDQNRWRSEFRRFLGVVGRRVGEKVRRAIRCYDFGATLWAQSVAPRVDFGNPENRKWHQNRTFEYRSAPLPSKNGPRERFRKNMKNL